MTVYDLLLAWNWEHDADFVVLLDQACQARGLTLLGVPPDLLDATLHGLQAGEIGCRVLFDRASDADDRYLALVDWARTRGVGRLNAFELARCAWDKAAMHHLLRGVLATPRALILPPFAVQPDLPPLDLAALGPSFDIKPAHGGGGKGVVIGAATLDQVIATRQEYPADQYLLQSHVVPAEIDARPAWFRVIACTGQIYPCWWHPDTHVYSPVSAEEEERQGLQPLRTMAGVLSRLCRLDLFSTEIALTPAREFVLVDYVNDPIDLRLQSKACDGVPDAIVQAVADGLAAFVAGRGATPAPSVPLLRD